MRWSFRVGRFFGIDVFVHATFLLLLAWIVLGSYLSTRNWGVAIDQLVFVVLVFTIVVLHEYGHALMARVFGVPTRDITLLPIGGVARLERMPEKPSQELAVALAGPAVNVVLALCCWIWATADGTLAESLARASQPTGLQDAGQPDMVRPLLVTSLSVRLLAINIALVVFNMIPAFPMDGGRVLRALLAMRLDYVRATRIAAVIGQSLALAFGFFGLMSGNFILVLIAFFVWIGAAQEAGATAQRSVLAGVPVRQAMITKFEQVTPTDTMDRVAAHVLEGFQHDFPVLDDGRVVGMITRDQLLKSLAGQGARGLVADVMDRKFLIARPDELLTDVVSRFQECACHSLPVLEDQTLIGILTSENIGEFLMIRSALMPSRA